MAKINPYVILDFETGGLPKNGKSAGSVYAATEVAMLCVHGDTLQEVGRYESYIKPYLYEYDPKALQFTGTTFEKLNKYGKDIKEVGQDIVERLKEWRTLTSNTHTKKPILVGHNVMYDIPFLQQISKESKCPLNTLLEGDPDFYNNFQPRYIDTILQSKLVWGADDSMTSYTLTSCITKAGGIITDAHKAINDVIATKDLLISIINRARSEASTTEKKSDIRVRDHFQF